MHTDPKPQIDPSTFFDVDIRVGKVVRVEDFPEARKPAHKVTADFGEAIGHLTTSAQITNYSKEELLGRSVVGVVNLPAKRIAGFESQFLILGAINGDGTVWLLSPDNGASTGDPVG